MKTCTKCHSTKALSEFYTHRKHGHHGWCKECMRAQRREHYAANREAQLAAKYEWDRKNPDKVAAQNRRYRERRPGDNYARVKTWRAANPQKRAEQGRRRRAALRTAVVETFDPIDIFNRDNWTCGICGAQVTADTVSIDHVVPLSKGGTHEPSNVQTAHRICNARKGARQPGSAQPSQE